MHTAWNVVDHELKASWRGGTGLVHDADPSSVQSFVAIVPVTCTLLLLGLRASADKDSPNTLPSIVCFPGNFGFSSYIEHFNDTLYNFDKKGFTKSW